MIEQLLKECEYIAKNPKKIISEYINKNNKKAVGMVPLFGPEELVDAAGMLPVGLWGGYNVEIDLAKQYFPAFCASMVNVIMELGLNGTYNMLSTVIIPGMTDTLNSLGQNWKSGVKNIPFIFMVYPQNRKLECGVEYLVEELKFVKSKLEEIKGSEILEKDIENSIEIYNKHRKAMREFSELAASHPNTITNQARSDVYKSSYFIPKKEHLEIVLKINEELKRMPEEIFDGKRIITTGLILDDPILLEILENNKLRIVGDYIAHESIQYNTDVPNEGKNVFERLANQWRDIEGFSPAYDPKKLRGKLIAELAKERKASGAIFALMKFSDLEEYDMPICLEDIKEAGISAISFEIEQQKSDAGQIKTRIQTFAEMI